MIKITIVIAVLIGLLIPYFSIATPVYIFYCLAPLVCIFAISFIIYLVSIIFSYPKSKKYSQIIVFAILTFGISQIISVLVVDRTLNHKAKKIITEVEYYKEKQGSYPSKVEISGIGKIFHLKYQYLVDGEFQIEYSRGFMVTEIYDSQTRNWTSRGWND